MDNAREPRWSIRILGIDHRTRRTRARDDRFGWLGRRRNFRGYGAAVRDAAFRWLPRRPLRPALRLGHRVRVANTERAAARRTCLRRPLGRWNPYWSLATQWHFPSIPDDRHSGVGSQPRFQEAPSQRDRPEPDVAPRRTAGRPRIDRSRIDLRRNQRRVPRMCGPLCRQHRQHPRRPHPFNGRSHQRRRYVNQHRRSGFLRLVGQEAPGHIHTHRPPLRDDHVVRDDPAGTVTASIGRARAREQPDDGRWCRSPRGRVRH